MPERLLDQRVFRRSLGLAVVMPLLLMAALAGALLWDVSQLLSTARWVDHTDEVIGQAHYAQSLLLDMETGVRGYLVTGSKPFLEPYTRANSQVDAAFGRLRRLATDNPAQGR